MKILLCACVFLFAAMALSAADVSGKWSGSFTATGPDGQTHDNPALVILKQNGMEITGSGGPDEGQQWPIVKGRIEGNKITFQVQSDGPLYKADLTVEGDRIKGEIAVERDGQSLKATLNLTRVK